MFARRNAAGPEVADLERIEAAVRARYGLAPEDLVLVTEEPGRAPGQPDAMTTVLFWHVGDRYRLRVFKRADGVTEADLPPSWLRGALRDEGEGDCC